MRWAAVELPDIERTEIITIDQYNINIKIQRREKNQTTYTTGYNLKVSVPSPKKVRNNDDKEVGGL